MADPVPIRRQPLRYEVRIEPTLDRRGKHQQAAILPSGEVIPGFIRLREWDEEVFLHECIHALCVEGELRLSEGDEEAVAQQVSQGLYAMGWRYVSNTQREDGLPGIVPATPVSGSSSGAGS